MSAGAMRRTTGSTLPETDVIDSSIPFWGIEAGRRGRCVDLGQAGTQGDSFSPFFTRKPGEVRGPYPGARNARRSTGIGTPQAARRQRMSSLPGAQLRTGAGTTMAEAAAPLRFFASGLKPA
jgi:hypothetical protein